MILKTITNEELYELEEGKWIIIFKGDHTDVNDIVFEGTLGMFDNCFAYGNTEKDISDFCKREDCSYKILSDVSEIEERFKLFGWTLIKD